MKTKNYLRLSCSALFISGLSLYNVSGQPSKPVSPLKPVKDTLHHLPVPKIHVELKSVQVGDTLRLKIDAPTASLFKLYISIREDSLISTVNVTGGITVLPALAAGHYHYKLVGDSGALVKGGSFEVRAPEPPKPPKPLDVKIIKGDTLKLWIGVPSSSAFTLNILTHKDSLLSTVTVSGGTNILPALPSGHYHYVLSGDSGIVAKGKFDLPLEGTKPPKPIHVKPLEARIIPGDTTKLWIGAPSSSAFTLNVLTHKDSLISSVAVSGGTNILAALPVGHYHYELLGDSAKVVAKGKFDLPAKGPKLDPKPIHPKPLDVKIKNRDSLEFWIGATVSESFNLRILTHKDSLLSIITVYGGSNYLTLLPGHYHYELEGDSGVVLKKGKFDVHPPRIKSIIAPNPSEGDGSITLDAPITDKFELYIYSSADIVSVTQISGGTTTLPLLSSGLYHYKVLDSNKNIVSKGRIIVQK